MLECNITLGELLRELTLEQFTRSKDCKIQVSINEDGKEFLHIMGDGIVTFIQITKDHCTKNITDRFCEKKLGQLFDLQKVLDAEIRKNGGITKQGYHKILVQHYKKYQE